MYVIFKTREIISDEKYMKMKYKYFSKYIQIINNTGFLMTDY